MLTKQAIDLDLDGEIQSEFLPISIKSISLGTSLENNSNSCIDLLNVECNLFSQALILAKGNRARAARMLGVSRNRMSEFQKHI
ncbi:helix-turn-helix domain-containing protein [Methylomonas sp. AM2-LC]|uniref:helix-turn-helix domain-containing protein n=1 Tax=Methylomonas sp. AM2-LC TaxID=3153301 RepID=UPI00326730FF